MFWLPTEFVLDFRKVYGVFDVVARPIAHHFNNRFVISEQGGYEFCHFQIGIFLMVCAYNVLLAYAPAEQYGLYGPAMVLDVQPIPNLVARFVYWDFFPFQNVGNGKGYKLFGKMVRAGHT